MQIDIASLLAKIGLTFLWRVVAERLYWPTLPSLPILRSHRREISSSLSRMPFIYKDLTTSVLKDFVELRMETLSSLSLQEGGSAIQVSSDQRILTRRKALFVGRAGIGKTTFFRYTALSLIDRSKRIEHFFPGERLVPFYVPLKAVDNTKPAPIFRYLLESHSYLSGKGGVGRLNRLSFKRRLILLLDGYDEIYIPPAGQRNFILDELNVLLAEHSPKSIGLKDSRALSFYSYAKECRIWLSTRKEFYALHPLDLDESRDRMRGPLGFVALAITGLHNRSLLVRKIFDIYRSRAEQYSRLSEEEFLQGIDLSGDDELIDLSSSPLFLTVMCYIYVQNLSLGEESNEFDYRRSNMSQLVSTCIDLLLEDLDEYRVRNMPRQQRLVFKNRRLRYRDEKEAFLSYFASRLLTRGMPVFTEAELVEAAKEFFRIEYRIGLADEILRGLESRNQSPHNFVRQLLNQGIFVLVPKTGGSLVYDFPHRRFREVLAARYMNDSEHIRVVLRDLDDLQNAEFLYVFFGVSQFQNEILEAILQRVGSAGKGLQYGVLASNCLRSRPKDYNATPLLLNFLWTKMESGEDFRVPRDVLDHLFPSRDQLRALEQRFREAVESENRHIVAVVGPALLRMSRPLTLELLASQLGAALARESILPVFAKLLAEADPVWFVSLADQFGGSLQVFRVWLWVGSDFDQIADDPKFCQAIAENVKATKAKVTVIDALQDRSPGLLSKVERQMLNREETEVLGVLVRNIRHPELAAGALDGVEEVFVVTDSLLNGAGQAYEYLRPLKHRILRMSDFPQDVRASDDVGRVISRARVAASQVRLVKTMLNRCRPVSDGYLEYFY